MYNVFDTEIFGIILTILFFNIGIYIQKKTRLSKKVNRFFQIFLIFFNNHRLYFLIKKI